MKHFCLIFGLFALFSKAISQEYKPEWNAGVNPLGLFEPLSNIGPCVEIRISPAVGLWTEASYILRSQYQLNSWKKVRGARFIFQPRFYFGRQHVFFIAPELRLKRFNYSVSMNFINKQTQDTLKNYFHRATQVQAGGGLVLGVRTWLSRRQQLAFEFTGGLGVKNRQITRHNIPAGYSYENRTGGFGLAPHYEWDNDAALYIPCSIRLIWKLESSR